MQTDDHWRSRKEAAPPSAANLKAMLERQSQERVREKAAVKALGEQIGYGNMITRAHELWDEMLESKWGISGHSRMYTLAAAELIRQGDKR